MSSYQKLKARVAELEKDIYLILKKGHTVEGIETRHRHLFRIDSEEHLMLGNYNSEGNGIVDQVQPKDSRISFCRCGNVKDIGNFTDENGDKYCGHCGLDID